MMDVPCADGATMAAQNGRATIPVVLKLSKQNHLSFRKGLKHLLDSLLDSISILEVVL